MVKEPFEDKAFQNLLSTGVRDIGLRSVSTDLGLEIFGRGRTSALFQGLGMELCAILALKIEQIGSASIGAQVFSTQLGISSGPIAFLRLIFSSSAST